MCIHACTNSQEVLLPVIEKLMVVVTCKLLLQAYFDEAGHWLYIEQPEPFNALVQQFVSGST